MASITAKINASTGSGPKKVSVTLPSGTYFKTVLFH